MLRLTIIDEDGRTVVVPLNRDEITIGRKEGNHIQLSERNISRNHALLTMVENDCFIDDLDSYNGVILNGYKIGEKTRVEPGDIMQLGDYRIRLEDVQEDRVDLVQSDILFASETSDIPFLNEVPKQNPKNNQSGKIFESVDLEAIKPKQRSTRSFDVQSAIIDNSVADYHNNKTKWIVSFIILLILVAILLYMVPSAKDTKETVKTEVIPDVKVEQKPLEKQVKKTEKPEALANSDKEFRNELIEESLASAKISFEKEEYKRAEKILNTLLADIPDAKRAKIFRDKVRLEHKNHTNYANGLRALKKKNAFQALTLLGGISKQSRYYEPARKRLNQARKTLVKDYVRKSESYYNRKKYEKAHEWANKALNIDSKNKKAEQLYKDSAQKLAESSKTKLSARSYYNIATDYYNKKQYDQALGMFRKVLDMDGNFAYAYRGLGASLARKGQMEEASKAYKRYLELMPNAPDKIEITGMIKEYEDSKR